MANSQSVDLMAAGLHCADADCKMLDFLPFKCLKCSKIYCLAHRVCPCNSGNENSVLVCPLCARAVVVAPGEDPELAFDLHTRTDCDPSNYDRVHRKPRCPVAGCKERLGSTNNYTCRGCAVTVCLKHRLPGDHQCAGRAAAATAAAAAAQARLPLAQSLRRMFSGGGSSSAAGAAAGAAAAGRPQQQQQPRQQPAAVSKGAQRPATVRQKAAAAAAKTKASVQSQLQQYRQQQQQRGQPAQVVDLTSGSPAAAAAGQEECQQCGAHFATVQQLIEHAETEHAAGWRSGAVDMQQQRAAAGGSGGLERCPHCGQGFVDAVQLVAHVERQHAQAAGGRGSDNCVVC